MFRLVSLLVRENTKLVRLKVVRMSSFLPNANIKITDSINAAKSENDVTNLYEA